MSEVLTVAIGNASAPLKFALSHFNRFRFSFPNNSFGERDTGEPNILTGESKKQRLAKAVFVRSPAAEELSPLGRIPWHNGSNPRKDTLFNEYSHAVCDWETTLDWICSVSRRPHSRGRRALVDTARYLLWPSSDTQP
jgi:hypothetical protein